MASNTTDNPTQRYVLAGIFLLITLFASYRYASAGTTGTGIAAAAGGGGIASLGASSGGGCCGGGGNSAPVTGTATLEGGVQKITVSAAGGFNPNTIKLKAGVPTEITFKDGSGCTGQVISQQLNFAEDISQGPKTVKLPALSAGSYQFSCGMQMVFGTIEVS